MVNNKQIIICTTVTSIVLLTAGISMSIYIYNKNNNLPREIISNTFPKIVHLIYFPWNKEGKLKDNEHDFNHTFYYSFQEKHPDWEIRLWTLTKIKNFVSEYYSLYKDIWSIIKHPTQAVDFFRLLVTYHYGGIYWQYDSIQNSSLNTFLPPKGKSCRLFIETIKLNNFSLKLTSEPIRQNKSEELIRVANQSFSAYPKDKFLLYCIEKSWLNLQNLEVKTQYDILYIGANAMISEAYDEYIDKDNITLTYNTNKYIQFSSNGSWRLNTY